MSGMLPSDWSTQQLAEFLEAISGLSDEREVMRVGVERAAEAFDAEIGVLVGTHRVEAAVGFGPGVPVPSELSSLTPGSASMLQVEGLGPCFTIAVPIEDIQPRVLILARSAEEQFSRIEETLLRSMGRVLVMACSTVRLIEEERRVRTRSEQQTAKIEQLLASLLERQRLFEKLSRIQSSISHRKPLQEVLDSIVQGAVDLLDSEVVGLRLVDPDDPQHMVTLASAGVNSDELKAIHRIPVGEGAGGRALAENRLVVIEHYDNDPAGLEIFREHRLQTAMAAPVHENGQPVGSLVVASYRVGRQYTEDEKAVLQTFAEHASLALTDAKTLESMREAQRVKDMFLAMVSHELKTPLTVIMGTLRTLERYMDSLDPGDRMTMLQAAYERGKDLQRLIDRLLQGASAELADVQAETFLPDAVAEAVRGFEHSFRLTVSDIPQVTLEMSAASIQRIIGILVENALAHAEPSTPIYVGADLERDEMTFWVQNEGSLPPGDPSELFQPFHRGEDATSSGVGLGLYIASRIAESMGGQLTAWSDSGIVRFILHYPLRKSTFPTLTKNLPL
jgi:signal transduction histidine kinase